MCAHSRISTVALGLLLLAAASGARAQTFTLEPVGQPGASRPEAGAPSVVRSAPDYATDVLGDPWDFEQATDHVYMFGIDDATLRSAWSSIPTMVQGRFTGTSGARIPRVQLLYEGIDGALNAVGRNGARFPIDTSRYRRLSLRMRRSRMPGDLLQATWFTQSRRAAGTVGGQLGATQGYDTATRRYHNQSPAAEQGSTGWHIYKIDLDNGAGLSYGVSWTAGPVRGLRLDLGNSPDIVGSTIEVDWVRLSERGRALTRLRFSGFGGPVTVTARHEETGDVIQVFPDDGTSSTTFADNSEVNWDHGFLSPGTWTVTAARGQTTVTQTLVIDPAPYLTILEPDAKGGRDYARTFVGDAYDMTNAQDITRDGVTGQLTNLAFGDNGLTATSEGKTSPSMIPDPFLNILDDSSKAPGTERIVDGSEYRHLTFTVEYDRKDLSFYEALGDLNGGILRVIWRAAGKRGGLLTNTQDLFVLDGGPETYSMDLATFSQFGDCTMCQLETGHGTDLWQGPMAVLRIDPYESDAPRWFRLADVRVAADDEPDGNGFFTITWAVADATYSREVAPSPEPGGDATLALYYDTDTTPTNGRVLIASGVPASSLRYRWSVAGLQAGRYFVYAVVSDGAGNTQGRYSGGPVRVARVYDDPTDTSGTGLPDAWRARYGVSDPEGDADEDGARNLLEFEAGTSPLVPNTWTLPEGATGYFTERIALANPEPAPAYVTLTFLRKGKSPIVRDYSLLGYGRLTVCANEVAGLASEEFSTVVTTSPGSVVVERTMLWGAQGYGGHTGKAVRSARTRWYLAEGDAGFFQTWILLANATSQPASITVKYLLSSEGTIVRQYALAANSRFTILANDVPGLAGQSFSADIESDVPITVERSMYFTSQGRFWNGGHVSAAVETPATEWFVAEGRTGAFFDEYLLLANPNPTAGTARIRYLMPSGVYRDVDYQLRPNSRSTVYVDGELAARGFSDIDVSARITSDVPIIVERAMYWPGNFSQWTEAHASAGVTTTGTTWALAEGERGSSLSYATYILFVNPSPTDANVRARVLRASGQPTDVTFTVPANSRDTKQASALGVQPGEQFGLLVESTNGVPLVVERAIYWNGGGQFWGGGTNETAIWIR